MGKVVQVDVPKVAKVKNPTTMIQVKDAVTFVKRGIHKSLKATELVATGSTATKPESIKLSVVQSKEVQKVVSGLLTEMKVKYPRLTNDQVSYIGEHFETHSTKYLK